MGCFDPDAASLNTMTLDEVDGVTTITTLVQHLCQEHRDSQLASGMEGGMQVSYDRLRGLRPGGCVAARSHRDAGLRPPRDSRH
jgi:hypothetical protein